MGYIYNWYKSTIFIFSALVFYIIFIGYKELETIQIILISSFMALLIHQFEEYIYPGGAPIVINLSTFKEKKHFINYPGNMLSSMIVNHLAHIVYITVIIFPQLIWLGLGTIFFNLFQFIGYGIQMNKEMKVWYNPGLASVIILFIPISIYYILFILQNNLVTDIDWILGFISFVIILLLTTVLPVQLLKDKNSPYLIPQEQIEKWKRVQSFTSLKRHKEL